MFILLTVGYNFRLSESSKMEGNDFIIFKHGCGNDSEYTMKLSFLGRPLTQFSEDSTDKMKEPCKNHIFYHVEVEFIGDQTNTFEYDEFNVPTHSWIPLDYENFELDIKHPDDDDENPKIFKIRRATLMKWDLTESRTEDIWFDKPPKIVLKSNDRTDDQMMLKGFERDDLKRKTTILRKINPSDCNFLSLGNQNIYLHWAIFVENFPEEILNKLSGTDEEVFIRRSHLYKEKPYDADHNVRRIAFGHRPIHLIDYYDVPDSEFYPITRTNW